MNAFPITINQISSTIQSAYTATKAGILYYGHLIKTEYAPALATKLSACALAAFACLTKILKSGPTAHFAIASALLLLSVAAFQMADRKDYENDVLAKSAWKTAGLVAFIASTTMTHIGLIACL